LTRLRQSDSNAEPDRIRYTSPPLPCADLSDSFRSRFRRGSPCLSPRPGV